MVNFVSSAKIMKPMMAKCILAIAFTSPIVIAQLLSSELSIQIVNNVSVRSSVKWQFPSVVIYGLCITLFHISARWIIEERLLGEYTYITNPFDYVEFQ